MANRVEVVSDEEREVLERWARRRLPQALALRWIVLAAAAGRPSKDIAARLGCTDSTVGKWRGRLARAGDLTACTTSRRKAAFDQR